MTEAQPFNMMLQALPSLWRSLPNSWGDSCKWGAVFWTSQLGCTAHATMLLMANRTQSSIPANPCKQKMPFTFGHWQATDNILPLWSPNAAWALLRRDLLMSFTIQGAFSCVVLAAVEQGNRSFQPNHLTFFHPQPWGYCPLNAMCTTAQGDNLSPSPAQSTCVKKIFL